MTADDHGAFLPSESFNAGADDTPNFEGGTSFPTNTVAANSVNRVGSTWTLEGAGFTNEQQEILRREFINDPYSANYGDYDPWIGTTTQTNRLKAYCKVLVNGFDVTDHLMPFLKNVRIVDSIQPTCTLEIDDRDALVPIPPVRSSVEVYLGWAHEAAYKIFKGETYDIEHGGDRKSGRTLYVHADALSVATHAKSPMQDSMGAGAPPGQKEGSPVNMGDWVNKIAGHAGINMTMHSAFSGVTRDFWSMNNESFMGHMRSLSSAMGGIFRVTEGNQGSMTIKGQHPGGGQTDTVVVSWSDNLISWRVRPFSAQGSWGSTSQKWYDNQAGQWLQKATQLGGMMGAPFSEAMANFSAMSPASNETNAQQENDGTGAMASTQPGVGRIVFNGEPRARFNGYILLRGVRPGVNGLYRIDAAEHIYDKAHGYITWCDVIIEAAAGNFSVGRGYPSSAPNIR